MESSIINIILRYLNDAGLGAYIYKESVTTSSVYIKFKDDRLGSLRVGDHNGKEKYKYRWNIRFDISAMFIEVDKIKRFYYPFDSIEKMVKDMLFFKSQLGWTRSKIIRQENKNVLDKSTK